MPHWHTEEHYYLVLQPLALYGLTMNRVGLFAVYVVGFIVWSATQSYQYGDDNNTRLEL